MCICWSMWCEVDVVCPSLMRVFCRIISAVPPVCCTCSIILIHCCFGQFQCNNYISCVLWANVGMWIQTRLLFGTSFWSVTGLAFVQYIVVLIVLTVFFVQLDNAKVKTMLAIPTRGQWLLLKNLSHILDRRKRAKCSFFDGALSKNTDHISFQVHPQILCWTKL